MSVAHVLDGNGDVASHCFQLGGDPRDAKPAAVAEQRQTVVTTASARQVTPAATKPTVQSADTPLSTAQILKQLRQRLRVVEREIKARKALEKERQQIQRLIQAALTETDNVRRLRSAG